MKKRICRMLSILLCVLMLVNAMPISALAAIIASDTSAGAQFFSMATDDLSKCRVNVTFKGSDGVVKDNQVAIYSAEKEQSLAMVEAPAMENKRFVGWMVDGEDIFGYTTKELVEKYGGQTITAVAEYVDIYYVYFMSVPDDDQGNRHVVYTDTCDANNNSVTAYAGYTPTDKRVVNWVNGDKVYAPGATISGINEDLVLLPNTTDCYWVTFDTMGGSSVPSVYMEKGGTVELSKISKPSRYGYTFAGWSYTEDGAAIPDETITVNESITLYALWSGDEVNYTVVYWGENADDEEYSVLATATKLAKTGDEVTLNETTGALPSSVTDRAHFTFKESDAVEIAADGSSVVNVYFSRNTYTITFRGLKCTEESTWWHTHDDDCYTTIITVKAKYDSKITNYFLEGIVAEQYPGRAWEITGYAFAVQTLDRMPGRDITCTLYQKSSNELKTIYYYVEALDDEPNPVVYNSKNYKLFKSVQTVFVK